MFASVKHEFIIDAFMIVSVQYQFICYGLTIRLSEA
jgi:hypothetical protein